MTLERCTAPPARVRVRRTNLGRTRWVQRRAELAALASLVALPLLVYALPALLGHPVVPGDDLTQNLPLRELVGRDLRSGRLPIFDPYLWGGAPLLAGWNAGAAYPLTWLFALLPGTAAWTVNLVAASTTAALGGYAFLRASRLGILASWAGATTFAFGGAMVAQVPHIGLLIGMSWAPLGLLAILRLTAPGPVAWPSRLRWAVVLGVTVGLVLVSGEPRAITDVAVVLVLYGAWRLVRLRRAAAAATVGVGAGALLGLGLGAIQLLPGLAAVATSQRAEVSAFLFGAGSLPVRWLALLGVPDLLGGSGSFGQPVFFANYNLTEVSGYVGLLPLVAAIALFSTWRRHRPLPDWLVWEVAAAAGILLALGTNTPLWHVLIHIPLFGGQRLQSRSILVTDLALAILLAYWLDGWVRAPRRPWRHARRSSRPAASDQEQQEGTLGAGVALGALPPLAVAGLVVTALAAQAPLLEWMGVADRVATHVSGLRSWLAPALVLALGALALVVAGPRLSPRTRGTLAAVLMVVDLVVFSVTAVVELGAPSPASRPSPPAVPTAQGAPLAARARPSTGRRASTVRSIAALHLWGRFAVYDPGLLDPSELAAMGVPDTNVLDGTWSVQGYGSIVDGPYAVATGVHGLSGQGQDVFSPRAAADGVLDSLSTQAVLAPSRYLRTQPLRTQHLPTQHLRTRPRNGRDLGTGSGRSLAGDRQLQRDVQTTWFLGTPLLVRSARIRIATTSTPGHDAAGGIRIGLLSVGGHVDWARARRTTQEHGASRAVATWEASWPSPRPAVGVVVGSKVTAAAGAPDVTAVTGRSYALDGVLQDGLAAPHWRYGGQDGAFSVFVDQRARTPLSLRPLAGRSLRGATVRRLSGPPLEPSAALVSSPHGVDVVRAVASVPGWTASWTASSGPPRPLAVRGLGVVQVVSVPAGRGVVTWRYAAPSLFAGELLSIASLALVAAAIVVAAPWCRLWPSGPRRSGLRRSGLRRVHRAPRTHSFS